MMRAAIQKVFIAGKTPLTVLYCSEHYRRSIKHFFDSAKDSQNKYFAGPAALLDSLCELKNQTEFDTKLKQISADSEEIANKNEKLFQLL